MYCELKNNEYWVWSSRKSSLDCIPQYKIEAANACNALLNVLAIQSLTAQKKAHERTLMLNRHAYRVRMDLKRWGFDV